jgi:hypothetical protein
VRVAVVAVLTQEQLQSAERAVAELVLLVVLPRLRELLTQAVAVVAVAEME